MSLRLGRRRFLKSVGEATLAASTGLAGIVASTTQRRAVGAELDGHAAKRVFWAGFAHETNTFHPVATTRFSFHEPGQVPLPAVAAWKDAGLSVVEGISAYPEGGGTIDGQACRQAVDRIVQSLRAAMPVDAVLLRLHGAMFAEGVGPAETLLIEQVRAAVGRSVPIACTFDLHGNIPARLGLAGAILVGFKTAPHTDQQATLEHAARLLLDALHGKIKPVSYVLPVPVIVPGEKAMTTSEPMRSLVAEARRVEREGLLGHAARILAATIFVGCAWTDSPDTGMAVAVMADGSRAAARAAAIHLARRLWEGRQRFSFGCETAELEQGVTRALEAPETTVFLTDSGDNVTASAPGDSPIVLRHLVERKVSSAVVAGIIDETATRRCIEAGEGKRFRLAIGATVEKRFGFPLDVEAEVVRLPKTTPRMAVIRLGGVEAVLSEQSVGFIDPRQFDDCGIDPLKRKIVVVKEGYLYPGLSRIAPRHIMLMTPGAGDMRIEKLAYVRRRKPLYPLEPDATFEPEKAEPTTGPG
jgi:microcystin degradation protein MlrC